MVYALLTRIVMSLTLVTSVVMVYTVVTSVVIIYTVVTSVVMVYILWYQYSHDLQYLGQCSTHGLYPGYRCS